MDVCILSDITIIRTYESAGTQRCGASASAVAGFIERERS
ncbi:hypothetical protein COPEUT_01113 [Coprococcus eutactus ATCC 27759]|nr:hypothetical protein COPEUT_01113 [Coprococcus eutactus ATCC 27759]